MSDLFRGIVHDPSSDDAEMHMSVGAGKFWVSRLQACLPANPRGIFDGP